MKAPYFPVFVTGVVFLLLTAGFVARLPGYPSGWIVRNRIRNCCLLVGLSFLLTGCLSRFFYYPDKVRYAAPSQAGLSYDAVEFASADGTKLTGWFIPSAMHANPKDAKGTVIHFHGNAQNMSAHWRFVSWLPMRGFNVFVFDYRGYGASHGSPEAKGVFEDSLAALNYVRSRRDVDPERLLVFGQSLGGTNAIAAVGSGNRQGVKAVAIEATFYSYSAIANDKMPGAGFFVDDTYSASQYVKSIAPIPLLLIHGTADQLISPDHSRMLFENAGEPKTMLIVEGGRHIDTLTSHKKNQYRDALVAFFESGLSHK